ncbi:MAG: caspase family protein, partial [Planctomycetales bacterium]
ARVLRLPGGNDWLVLSPWGWFDGTQAARRKVACSVDGKIVLLDRMFDSFYRPGLLDELLGGDRPVPQSPLTSAAGPTLEIVSPEQGSVENDQISLEVNVVDQGAGIRGPWLMHNGARLTSVAETQQEGDALTCRFSVRLIPGLNRLEVHAADEAGRIESVPATRNFVLDAKAGKPTLHVVAVGVNRYANGLGSLGYAAADAEAITNQFQTQADSLFGDVRAQVLTDERATTVRIASALKSLAEETSPSDTVLIYLAGLAAIDREGQLVFLPHDASGTLQDGAGESSLGISEAALGEALDTVAALHRVVVLDVCGNGQPGALHQQRSLRAVVNRISRNRGAVVVAAGSSTTVGRENQELAHGWLTYSLLAGLRAFPEGPLQGSHAGTVLGGKIVTAAGWIRYAQEHLPKLFSEPGRSPRVFDALPDNDFPMFLFAESKPKLPMKNPPMEDDPTPVLPPQENDPQPVLPPQENDPQPVLPPQDEEPNEAPPAPVEDPAPTPPLSTEDGPSLPPASLEAPGEVPSP